MIIKRPIKIYFNLCFLFFPLSLIFLLSGCVSTEDLGRVQWDVNELKSEIRDVKVKSPTPVERDKLDKKLSEIQGTQESTAKSVSELMIQFQSLTNEFRVLTGRFEETRYNTEKSSAALKEEKENTSRKIKELELAIDDIEKKLSHLEKPETPAKQEELKQPDDGKASEGSGKGDAQKPDVKDIYMTAYEAYKNGKTVEAREKFIALLKDYPNNEYADNSRFWIAESFYKDGNYEDAILAYEEVLKKNPKSDKAPGALLKQGLAFYELKDEKTGKIILEKLIQTYPDSEQAATAKKKIGKPAASKKK